MDVLLGSVLLDGLAFVTVGISSATFPLLERELIIWSRQHIQFLSHGLSVFDTFYMDHTGVTQLLLCDPHCSKVIWTFRLHYHVFFSGSILYFKVIVCQTLLPPCHLTCWIFKCKNPL